MHNLELSKCKVNHGNNVYENAIFLQFGLRSLNSASVSSAIVMYEDSNLDNVEIDRVTFNLDKG